jgi:hypothetical protein
MRFQWLLYIVCMNNILELEFVVVIGVVPRLVVYMIGRTDSAGRCRRRRCRISRKRKIDTIVIQACYYQDQKAQITMSESYHSCCRRRSCRQHHHLTKLVLYASHVWFIDVMQFPFTLKPYSLSYSFFGN